MAVYQYYQCPLCGKKIANPDEYVPIEGSLSDDQRETRLSAHWDGCHGLNNILYLLADHINNHVQIDCNKVGDETV